MIHYNLQDTQTFPEKSLRDMFIHVKQFVICLVMFLTDLFPMFQSELVSKFRVLSEFSEFTQKCTLTFSPNHATFIILFVHSIIRHTASPGSSLGAGHEFQTPYALPKYVG